jgi:hypothetical protein
MTIKSKPEDGEDVNVNDQTREQRCVAIANATALEDMYAPWEIPDELQGMGQLWQKKVRPGQWSLDQASLPRTGYVLETYRYVDAKYSGDIWWHHMALVWAILFSRITPYLFRDRTVIVAGVDSTEITKQIRNMEWVDTKSDKQKGCTMPMPYITMLSTTIIALLDRSSPLWSEYKNFGFGTTWSDKHGICSIYQLCERC